MNSRPAVGEAAPDFEGPTSNESHFRLKDCVGRKNVVLYFYPKYYNLCCDIKSCPPTTCRFKDRLQPVRAQWTEVVGISADTLESHKAFSRKHSLNFPLISDHDKAISRLYGVLGEDGSVADRVTFIIDKEGKITKVFAKTDITKRTHEVVAALKQHPFHKAKFQNS